MFRSGYANTGKKFSITSRALIKRKIITSREVLHVHDAYKRNQSFFSLKMSAQAKKRLTQHVSTDFPSLHYGIAPVDTRR